MQLQKENIVFKLCAKPFAQLFQNHKLKTLLKVFELKFQLNIMQLF